MLSSGAVLATSGDARSRWPVLEALVERDVVLGHAFDSKPPVELCPDYRTVQCGTTSQCRHGLVDSIDNEAGDAVANDFGDGTAVVSNHRRSAGKGFYHREAERLGPGDGKQERGRAAKELAFVRIVDFADEIDQGMIE